MLFKVTVAFVTVPGRLDTTIVEGYGVARPTLDAVASLIVMLLLLTKLVWARPRTNVKLTRPRLFAPSVARKVATTRPPLVPLAVKENSVERVGPPAASAPRLR